MKIKTEALLGAVMFGLVIQVIYSVISTLSLYNTLSTVDLNQPAAPLSSAASLLGCCIFLLTGLGVGLLYVYLHNREEDASAVAVKGGAVSGAISYAAGGLISAIISAIALAPVMNELMATILASPEFAGAGDDFVAQATGAGLVGGAIGLCCWAIFAAVLGSILGAIGGAIGRAMFKPTAGKPVEFDGDNF
jgi:hypothetical protein